MSGNGEQEGRARMSGGVKLRFALRGTIERDSLLGLLLVGTMIAVAAWLVLSALATMNTIATRLEYNGQLISAIQALEAHLVDVETGERGYLITGNERYLEPYHEALQELDDHRRKLAGLVAGTPLEASWLPELSARIERKLTIARGNVAARKQGFEVARQRLLAAGGKREMDAIRHLLDEQSEVAERDVRQLWDEQKQALSELLRKLALAALLLIGALLFIHFRLRREMRRRHEAEVQVEHLATHDSLTGLPNRRWLVVQLEQALKRCERHQRMAALLFLDLNGFKPVNDRHGHQAGDEVLQQVAVRLQHLIRASDFVARLGGDEFVVFIEDIAGDGEVCRVIDKITAEIARPFRLPSGIEVGLSTSIGVALYPRDGAEMDGLMSHADTAMYAAKESGDNCFCNEVALTRRCGLFQSGGAK